jgi:hypothetical protein
VPRGLTRVTRARTGSLIPPRRPERPRGWPERDNPECRGTRGERHQGGRRHDDATRHASSRGIPFGRHGAPRRRYPHGRRGRHQEWAAIGAETGPTTTGARSGTGVGAAAGALYDAPHEAEPPLRHALCCLLGPCGSVCARGSAPPQKGRQRLLSRRHDRGRRALGGWRCRTWMPAYASSGHPGRVMLSSRSDKQAGGDRARLPTATRASRQGGAGAREAQASGATDTTRPLAAQRA